MARSLASAEKLESVESEEGSDCEDEPTPSKRMKSSISVKKIVEQLCTKQNLSPRGPVNGHLLLE